MSSKPVQKGEVLTFKCWQQGYYDTNQMTDDNLKIEIEQLKKDIFSDDWELVKSSADRLGKIGGEEVFDFL